MEIVIIILGFGFFVNFFGMVNLLAGNSILGLLTIFAGSYMVIMALAKTKDLFHGAPIPFKELKDGKYKLKKDCGYCLYLITDGKKTWLVKITPKDTSLPLKEGDWFVKRGGNISFENKK